MSTSSLNLNTSGTSGVLSTSGTTAQIVGLASGLDTTAIISELMAVASFPEQRLEVQQSGVQAKENELSTLQTTLQNLSNDAANLSSPTLFDTSQSVSSSDPSVVAATSSTGAGVGGYEVLVTALANSAQRTFTYASPTTADTVTIDGHTTTIPAGSTIAQFVNSINSDSQATVYAAATSGSTVVLSSRTSGDTGTGFIALSDPGGALTEQTALAKQGQDAQFSVDGVSGTSSSNTVTNAIPGVSLTLSGITSGSPVTVTVAPPAPSAANITTAVNQFVTDYNAAVTQIQSQLTTAPVSNPQNATDAGQGTLYGDEELNSLLTNMRQMMYTDLSGLPGGMSNLSDIGVTTGAPSGSASPSSSSISGLLTVDTSALTAAIQSNPSGVQGLLAGFSTSFQSLVGSEAGPGGVISQRITDEASESTQMGNQLSVMQATLATQQSALETEYADLESALSLSQSQESSLSSQIAQLP
jgi:flagellar hook-associated protein 2